MAELTQQRKEFEAWLGTETCEVHWDESAEKNAWYGWQASRSSLESENAELLKACKWMSKACGLSAQLHAALKALIPSPGSLSPEKHALWQVVINVIYESGDFADTRESVKLLREGKF